MGNIRTQIEHGYKMGLHYESRKKLKY